MSASFPPVRAFALMTAALLTGCTVGPDYHAPKTSLAANWSAPATSGAVEQVDWWRSLNDKLLDSLVDEMLAGNPSLKEAQARLAEARANRDAVAGRRLPQAQVTASGAEVELSKNGQIPVGDIPGFSREFGLFDLGFDASWELDLWGQRRRAVEAATARSEAAALAEQGTRLQLIAELARSYVDLRLAQHEEGLAGEALAARKRLAGLTQLLAKAGEASQIQAERARSDEQGAKAALANAQAAARAAALRVAVLVGVQPEQILPRLEKAGSIPVPPAAIAAGLPSDLLRRRPDIRVAERELAASTADIGVATADLFPHFSLGLSVGQQARSVSDLVSGDSTRLQAGPSLTWPIFSGGSVRAKIRAADARTDAVAARYDAAVIGALADSETAINRFDRSRAAYHAAREAAAHDHAAFVLSEQRARHGEDDQLVLARSRLQFIAARRQADEAQAAATGASIALHKALGGGWSGLTDE